MKRSWEDTLDSDDEDLFNQVLDDFEGTQKGGGSRQPLFAFTLASIGPRRRWKNVVERAQFRAELHQLREPVVGDDIGGALTDALRAAIERELRREVRHPNDFVNFSITAHGFTHAYQSINFQVGEFLARSVLVHGPIVILVPTRGTKDDCCKLIAHKVEIENLYDNLSVGVAFRVFFSCKSAGNDL